MNNCQHHSFQLHLGKKSDSSAKTRCVGMQIASTWEGIRACEILQKQGIETNMTLLFSFAQVCSVS